MATVAAHEGSMEGSVETTTLIIFASNPNYTFYADPLGEAANMIQRNYLKVLCAVGLPGNLATLAAMTLVIRPVSTNSFLLALLAAFDSLALVLKLLFNQLHFSLPSYTDAFCRAQYLTNVCSTFANWVLVVVGVERLLAVRHPFSRTRYCGRQRVYVVCAALFAGILAVHLPYMIHSVAADGFWCLLTEAVSGYATVHPWLNMALYAFLPTSLLIIITLVLVLSLWRAAMRRRMLQGSVTYYVTSCAQREARRSERTFTVMTLAATLLFSLLVLPQCVYYILFQLTGVLSHLVYTPVERMVRQVTYVLVDSTHALNFYFYVISAKRFRQRLALYVRSSIRLSRSTPSNSSPLATSVSKLSCKEVHVAVNAADKSLLPQDAHNRGAGKSTASNRGDGTSASQSAIPHCDINTCSSKDCAENCVANCVAGESQVETCSLV